MQGGYVSALILCPHWFNMINLSLLCHISLSMNTETQNTHSVKWLSHKKIKKNLYNAQPNVMRHLAKCHFWYSFHLNTMVTYFDSF